MSHKNDIICTKKLRMVKALATKAITMAILLLLALTAGAASQGYMGTVSTGRGILSPISVGEEEASGAQVGLSGGLNLSGSWSADLRAGTARHRDLDMFQQDDLLVGSGLMDSAGRSINITAAGSVRGEELTVFLLPEGGEDVFRLELSASGTALSGVYEATSRGMPIESGTVTGKMGLSAPQNEKIAVISAASPLPAASSSYAEAVKDMGRGSPSGRINESIYKSSSGQSAGAEGSVTTSDRLQDVAG